MVHTLARELVGRLDPPPGTGPVASDPAEVAAATEALGDAAVAWGLELGRQGFDRVISAMTRTERMQIPALELQRAIEQSTLDLLRILAGEHFPYELNAHQLAVVREMVRQDVPFERIIRGLRRVQRHWTDALLDLIERDRAAAGEARELLRTVLDVITAFSDANVNAVIEEYLYERQRLMAQRLTDRREMVSSIIAGEHVTEEMAQRTLGTGLDQHHLAFVVWLSESHGSVGAGSHRYVGAHAELERVAQRAAEHLHCPTPLTLPRDDATVWAWACRPRPFPDDYPKAFAFARDEPYPVRVAIGIPGHGIAGFRRSHLAARDAHRVTTSAGPAPASPASPAAAGPAADGQHADARGNGGGPAGPAGPAGPSTRTATAPAGVAGTTAAEGSTAAAEAITAYRDVDLVALLSTDIERARWFVTEELGGLVAADQATTELRLTLLCYLDGGGSLVSAATALHRHRNTIVHRLRRVEELLGRPISERTQQTHAALTLAARLGNLVLP